MKVDVVVLVAGMQLEGRSRAAIKKYKVCSTMLVIHVVAWDSKSERWSVDLPPGKS